MAYWVVRQSLARLNLDDFDTAAAEVVRDVGAVIDFLYATKCLCCGQAAIVKYFLWIKVQDCPICGVDNDLFPGYLLAEAVRHPRHVVACGRCGALNECDRVPTIAEPTPCHDCGWNVHVEGPAKRRRTRCQRCETVFPYPAVAPTAPPRHRLWAIEYHCDSCKASHPGRFFKRPDSADLNAFADAKTRLDEHHAIDLPADPIPDGDETDRLHRWGYRFYREMFNDRQLFGLGILLRRIRQVPGTEVRHALLTVFSDFLRYQNILCRYDTYALKCQDIFSVHGFPVGLVQCENNLLGIPRVGSGSFRHFVAKYLRAKSYAEAPFEVRHVGGRKHIVPITGERIMADIVDDVPTGLDRHALLFVGSAGSLPLAPGSLDGVFTDPPYFDNVQYAELMDFCYVWLKIGLAEEIPAFRAASTRAELELTGNATLGRGIDHFTTGLSEIFRHYAAALKPGAPFVFTYHHNDPAAYSPLVVAILDAGLVCTAVLPVPAEMGASLHIVGTGSSVVDSVFVCRASGELSEEGIDAALRRDATALAAGGVKLTHGDLRCLVAGHTARLSINRLRQFGWDEAAPLDVRMQRARHLLSASDHAARASLLIARVLVETSNRTIVEEQGALAI